MLFLLLVLLNRFPNFCPGWVNLRHTKLKLIDSWSYSSSALGRSHPSQIDIMYSKRKSGVGGWSKKDLTFMSSRLSNHWEIPSLITAIGEQDGKMNQLFLLNLWFVMWVPWSFPAQTVEETQITFFFPFLSLLWQWCRLSAVLVSVVYSVIWFFSFDSHT